MVIIKILIICKITYCFVRLTHGWERLSHPAITPFSYHLHFRKLLFNQLDFYLPIR